MEFEKSIIQSMEEYFDCNTIAKWMRLYEGKVENIDHDEPWLTLVSLFSMFNDQKNIDDRHANALQCVMHSSGFNREIKVDSIVKVSIERVLPEIKAYREYLYGLLKTNDIHLYPDRNNTLKKRVEVFMNSGGKKQASLEGSTNLDAQITFNEEGRRKYIFIEAKFLSDIDTKTKYNPIRNQVIRNIDAMIDFVMCEQEKGVDISYKDVYFCMLTPKVFRTQRFTGNNSSILDLFTPQKARFYCYVMDDYKNPSSIKRDLPHRNTLTSKDWDEISKGIGWMTYDDMYVAARSHNTIESYNNEIEEFFRNRKLFHTR